MTSRRAFLMQGGSFSAFSIIGCSTQTLQEQNIGYYCSGPENINNAHVCRVLKSSSQRSIVFSLGNLIGAILGSLIGMPVRYSEVAAPKDFDEAEDALFRQKEKLKTIDESGVLIESTRKDVLLADAVHSDFNIFRDALIDIEEKGNTIDQLSILRAGAPFMEAAGGNADTLDVTGSRYSKILHRNKNIISNTQAQKNNDQLLRISDQNGRILEDIDRRLRLTRGL